VPEHPGHASYSRSTTVGSASTERKQDGSKLLVLPALADFGMAQAPRIVHHFNSSGKCLCATMDVWLNSTTMDHANCLSNDAGATESARVKPT